MTITRKLPNSDIGRQNALDRAFGKQASMPPAVQVLNPATVSRLNVAKPDYTTALTDRANAKAALNTHTPLKTAAVNVCRMFVSHFIQVFNLGVARGKYPAGNRSYYQLPSDSAAVPNLDTESSVREWALRLINGDVSRLAAGGLAMANPDIAEVTAVHASADALLTAQNTLISILQTKQQDVDKFNADVDKLIARIWDEVEAYYSEDDDEGKRASARLWGVIYVTQGPAAILTGLVRDALGNPRVEAEVVVIETGAKAITNAEGRYILPTTVIGDTTVQATYPGQEPATVTVTIAAHEEEVTIAMADIVI
jgi:hypothetical protein